MNSGFSALSALGTREDPVAKLGTLWTGENSVMSTPGTLRTDGDSLMVPRGTLGSGEGSSRFRSWYP